MEREKEFSFYPSTYKVDETGIYSISFLENKQIQRLIYPTSCFITAIGVNIDNGIIVYKLEIIDSVLHKRVIWKTTRDLMRKLDVLKLLDEGMLFKEASVGKMIDYFYECTILNKGKLTIETAASVSGWKKKLFFVCSRKSRDFNRWRN